MAAKDIEAGRAHVLLAIRDRMSQGLKLAEKRFQQFGRYAATTGAVVTAGVGTGLLWPLKLSANMEQATVAMSVFLGSDAAAKKMIADLEKMGAQTPFQFDELKDAAQLLMGFGIQGNQVLPMLRMLGDVSAGNSERFQRLALAFGQVKSKGRLMGQEVMQMTEQMFNPLAQMADDMAKTFGGTAENYMPMLTKRMEEGQVSFRDLVKAFQSATGPGGRFNGMMAKQSATLTGLTSTLIDYSKMVGRALGDTLLPMFKQLATAAISVAQPLAEIIKANGALVGSVAKVALAIGVVFAGLTGLGLAALVVSFGFGMMASGLLAMQSILLSPIRLVSALASGFMFLVTSTAAAGTAIVGIVTAVITMLGSPLAILGAMFSPIGILTGLFIGAAAAALVYHKAFYEAFAGITIWAQSAVGAFYRILGAAGAAIEGVVNALMSGNIPLAGAIAIGALKAMFWQAVVEIPGSAQVLATSYGQAILGGRWDIAAALAMANVKLVIQKAWDWITGMWSGQTTGIGALWDIVVHSIRTGWHTTSTALASGMLWIVGAFRSGITAIVNLFDHLSVAAQLVGITIKGALTGSLEEARAKGQVLQKELNKRVSARILANDTQSTGEQKALAQDAKKTQNKINTEFETSMIARSQAEQQKNAGRGAGARKLQAEIDGLTVQANEAPKKAGISTAQEAADKARMDLAKLTDAARNARDTKGQQMTNQFMPGISQQPAGIPKVESQGTFSAAAAAAFGGRSNSGEETARNTAAAVKWLRLLNERRGAQFI